jgi:hypothetical protein
MTILLCPDCGSFNITRGVGGEDENIGICRNCEYTQNIERFRNQPRHAIRWTITAMWAGNLTNVPLVGTIVDYAQIEPGLIKVVILCAASDVPAQVAKFTDPEQPWCSGMEIEPYFKAKGQP